MLTELSIVYCTVGYLLTCILKDNKKIFIAKWIVSIIFLGLGYACCLGGYTLAGMDKVFSCFILFHGGFTLKKYGYLSRERSKLAHLAILVFMFIILIACNCIGTISIAENSYVNPVYLLVTSFAGWLFLYEISFFLQKLIITRDLLICIGQNTLAVVILHFLCFKIVSYIGAMINHQPLCLVAAFPILYKGGAWWIAYTFAGLFIPISLSVLWKNIKTSRRIY